MINDKTMNVVRVGKEGESDENKSFKPNQIAPSVYMMIELYFFSLDQWEIKIHVL